VTSLKRYHIVAINMTRMVITLCRSSPTSYSPSSYFPLFSNLHFSPDSNLSYSNSSSSISSSSSSTSTSALVSARRYIRSATVANTRRKYASAVKLYNSYFTGRPNDPHGRITLEHALQWLSSLADGRQHATNTISAYKSALSTEFMNSTDALTMSNPLEDALITQLMKGITNENAIFDLQRRASIKRSDAVTMSMVVQLNSIWSQSTHNDIMMLAAVSISVCGGLRPSELLGSNDNRTRRLTLDQLVFFSDNKSRNRINIHSGSSPQNVPDHCVLSLHISKTVQHGTPPPTVIGHVLAVTALWRWAIYRYMIGAVGHDDIFTFGNIALKSSTLVYCTQRALRSLGHDDIHLTGKCFRIGAASTLAAQGIDSNDISISGRWSTDGTMWIRYATSISLRQRALEVNRNMS
jgi:hypothetical protein